MRFLAPNLIRSVSAFVFAFWSDVVRGEDSVAICMSGRIDPMAANKEILQGYMDHLVMPLREYGYKVDTFMYVSAGWDIGDVDGYLQVARILLLFYVPRIAGGIEHSDSMKLLQSVIQVIQPAHVELHKEQAPMIQNSCSTRKSQTLSATYWELYGIQACHILLENYEKIQRGGEYYTWIIYTHPGVMWLENIPFLGNFSGNHVTVSAGGVRNFPFGTDVVVSPRRIAYAYASGIMQMFECESYEPPWWPDTDDSTISATSIMLMKSLSSYKVDPLPLDFYTVQISPKSGLLDCESLNPTLEMCGLLDAILREGDRAYSCHEIMTAYWRRRCKDLQVEEVSGSYRKEWDDIREGLRWRYDALIAATKSTEWRGTDVLVAKHMITEDAMNLSKGLIAGQIVYRISPDGVTLQAFVNLFAHYVNLLATQDPAESTAQALGEVRSVWVDILSKFTSFGGLCYGKTQGECFAAVVESA